MTCKDLIYKTFEHKNTHTQHVIDAHGSVPEYVPSVVHMEKCGVDK